MNNPYTWAQSRAENWWQKACNLNYLGVKLLLPAMPVITFSNRMQRTGGLAFSRFDGQSEIRLNTDLLFQEGERFDVVIGHEIAHIFSDLLWRKRNHHNGNWGSIMIQLGLAPARCHQFDVEPIKRHARFNAKCPPM